MSEKNSNSKKLYDELRYKNENFFEISTDDEQSKAYEYAKGYMTFLDLAKTEREAVNVSVKMAEEKGYKKFNLGDKLKAGDKKYYLNRNKSIAFIRMGNGDIKKDGLRIIVAHVDAPRIDLKQNPLYENSGMCFFKTHYYGGIKKYQWTAIPLALHGVVMLRNGKRVDITIGESDNEPVFYINDILPHLGKEQMAQPLSKAIQGEDLNVVVGAKPYSDSEDVKDKIKLTVLKYLNEKFGMVEEDFLSAELCVVPAFKAREVGFDRALIGAYGHDDRVCAYPALTAMLDVENEDKTILTILVDKEEIGSEGNTSMQSAIFADIIDEIASNVGITSSQLRAKSKCLSCDVTSCYDPNFSSQFEKRNTAMLSCGAVMCKFTGSGGKGGSNDASAEFIGEIRKMFADNSVCWQMGELGKVDAGGGGTVAKYVANLNIDTVDLGVPVISMHAPYELISKADLYSTYKAFKVFIK